MNKILLASHGPLANGMKKTAEFLMGQNENVETLCAYVDEQSKDLPAMVEKWMNERNPEDQWVVITDIFGGSINNEFMIRAQEGGYWLIAGMNLPLVQIPLHRITDSASNGSVFPVVTEHFSASSDHAFL